MTSRHYDMHDYLRGNVRYQMGDEEYEGLRLFYQMATDLGLAGPHTNLRFVAENSRENCEENSGENNAENCGENS